MYLNIVVSRGALITKYEVNDKVTGIDLDRFMINISTTTKVNINASKRQD